MKTYKGVTTSGFEFEIEACRLDDMELVDALSELEAGSPLAISKVGRLLLGESLKQALYKKLKAENGGRIPVESFSSEITAIMETIGDDGKKS